MLWRAAWALALAVVVSSSGCAYCLREPVQDVTVTSNVPSARITVDGALVAAGPMKLTRAKAHEIVATAEGYPPARAKIEPSTSVGPAVADVLLTVPTFGVCWMYDLGETYGSPIKAFSPSVTVELTGFDENKAKAQTLAGAALVFDGEGGTTTVRLGSGGKVEGVTDQGKDGKVEAYEVSRFGRHVAEDGNVVVEIVASKSASVDSKLGGGFITLRRTLRLSCNVETGRFTGKDVIVVSQTTVKGGRQQQSMLRPEERAVEGRIERAP